MDPLARSGERCSADVHCSRSFPERPMGELEISKMSSHNCVKRLLMQDETSDLAYQLISWSLTSPTDTNQTTSESVTGLSRDLVDLSTLDGLRADRIGIANLSSAQLDLDKLSAQLPAQENYSVPLEALGLRWQVWLSVLYSVTAVISILLNLITVIVLYRGKPSELRKYLINLAISDLCTSLFAIPFTYRDYMLGYWDYPPFLCPVVRLMVTLAVYVSVCTMVVIGVNRHLAILYPMKKCSMDAWKCGKNWVILGIWLSGLVISLPEYMMNNTTKFCYNQKFHLSCRNTLSEPISRYYSIFIFLATFLVPFMLLCYLYSSIGIQLKHREMPGNANATRDLSIQTKRAKVVKMLIVVVVMFAIFWLPLQTFSMLVLLWPTMREVGEYGGSLYNLFVGTYFIFHWMSMAHSCLNPLIYCFMNPKFRNDLRDFICASQLVCFRDGPLVRRPRTFASHSTSTLRPLNLAHNSSLRSSKQQEQFARCVRLKLDALNRVDKLNGNSLHHHHRNSTRGHSGRRRLSIQESCLCEPITSRALSSAAANSNHVANNTPNSLATDATIIENTPPDGESLSTTQFECQILACGGSPTGQPVGLCERTTARWPSPIAGLPEVSAEEEVGEEEEEELGVEVARTKQVQRLPEIGPTQLVIPIESTSACKVHLGSHHHGYQKQAWPLPPELQNKSAQNRGKSAPVHRTKVGKLARLMRSLSSSGLFGASSGQSANCEPTITSV